MVAIYNVEWYRVNGTIDVHPEVNDCPVYILVSTLTIPTGLFTSMVDE